MKSNQFQVPKVLKKGNQRSEEFKDFPLAHYSYSSFTKFSSNPLMFKVNNINGDVIETTTSASNVLGQSIHKALQYYLGCGEVPTPLDEGEAIKFGHAKGLEYLTAYSDGFIEYPSTIPTRAKLEEKYAFCYFRHIKEWDWKKEAKEIIFGEKVLKHRVEVEGKLLPIPLKGVPDLVYRDYQDRLKIRDYKITGAYSREDAIDGAKLLQAAMLYLLVYAETGEAPYSCTFAEFKHTKNQDGSPQLKEFEIVYADTPLLFEFFYRFYEDVTNALLGKQVYVPNVYAIYDKEVSIMAYIHRLDVDEYRVEAFKKMKVDNITDFLKQKIESDGKMKKYLETVTQKFVSATTLNYKDMTIEEKIKMKLAEHGLGIQFDSKIEGHNVVLYRYEPSLGLKMSKIESYAKDIEQTVGVSGIRILAPIPDSTLIGFEVPKKDRTFPTEKPTTDGFNVSLGVNTMGETVRMDIREAPHMIVAGSTGSGKSVFLDAIISQLTTIDNAKLYLLDPKMVELTIWKGEAEEYADTPKDISRILAGLVKIMNDRYKLLQKAEKKNINDTSLSYLFVILDEYGDLVSARSGFEDDIRSNILLLVQKARAAGIHLILTTQRPSVKIISGDIKANAPTRIAFRTASAIDSQVILDQSGAEKLLGKGDMLALLPGTSSLVRLQGYSI